MTLVEFLSPILKAGTHLDRVLAVLYFCARYEDATSLSSDEIRSRLIHARARNARTANVPDVLSKSGVFATIDGERGRAKLWRLTDSGAKYVRTKLGLPDADPEIEHDIGTLEKVVRQLEDADVRAYLDEALRCLQVGALRACVVFAWAGTIRTIQERMLAKGPQLVTAALQKHDFKGRAIQSVDDFAYYKETHQLQAAQDLVLIDKGQKKILADALDLRNNCGHPGKYSPGEKKVSSFVEDIVGIVFT